MDEKPIKLPHVRLGKAYQRIFDGIRPVARVEPNANIRFLDSKGLETGYEVVRGYYIRPLSDGTGSNDKEFMIFITDREGMDSAIYIAERFDIGDTRYERVGAPSSPSANPALWMIRVKPIKRRSVPIWD